MNHLQGWLGSDLHLSPQPQAPGSIQSQLECLRDGHSLGGGGSLSGTLGVTSTYKLDRIEMQMGFLSI